MNVVIPIVSAAANISGVQRHAINLVRCLLQFPQVRQVHLLAGAWQTYLTDLCPADPRLTVEFVPVRNTLIGRNVWYYAQLPRLCSQREVDIVHVAYPVPLRSASFTAPIVATLHDMYPFDLPENFGLPKAFFNQQILMRCVRAVDAVACVSNSTMHRLDRLEPRLALSKAIVIPNAVGGPVVTMTRPSAIAEFDPFLLCVAQHRRNKNILLLLQSFLYLREHEEMQRGTRLVIVGVNGPETAAIKRFIHAYALEEAVVLQAGLSEGELNWCYRKCTLLVAPSIMEGFGLPIAEGLLAGCRIVCSDIPAFREVGGKSCDYTSLDGNPMNQLASAIARTSLQTRPAPVSLPLLSYEAVGQQYIDLYGSLLHEKRSVPISRERPQVHPMKKPSGMNSSGRLNSGIRMTGCTQGRLKRFICRLQTARDRVPPR